MIKNHKRILIISKSTADISTEDVIDWLILNGNRPERLNGDSIEDFKSHGITFSINDVGELISNTGMTGSFYSIWLRRWSDYSSLIETKRSFDNSVSADLVAHIISQLTRDLSVIENFILSNIRCVKFLGSDNKKHGNKLNNLLLAKKHNLEIPEFILTTEKTSLNKFFEKYNKKIILKDLSITFNYDLGSNLYTTYTELITEEDISNFPDKFYLSFFQEYIEKEYEIRCFILETKVYSMAIFSQIDDKTKVDCRKYNFQNPNRTVPYSLPLVIEKQLINLFSDLKLLSGSVDLIKGLDKKYYFLEINSDGQFGMVAECCNYNINYEIAKFLCS